MKRIRYFLLGGCFFMAGRFSGYAQPLHDTAPLSTVWSAAARAATVPLPEYPRPQLQRKEWLNLNGRWDYQGGVAQADPRSAEAIPVFDENTAKILVPY